MTISVIAVKATCGAKTRAGTPCVLRAGWGTDHFGEGRCRLHGGKSPRKHGRYSKVPSKAVREIIAELEAEPIEQQLDVLPEARMIRALAQDFIERYNKRVDALIAWNMEDLVDAGIENRKPRPQPIPSLHDAASLLESASRVVEKIHKQQAQNAISRNDFYRVMGEMGRVVETFVDDHDAKDRIKNAWLSIRL